MKLNIAAILLGSVGLMAFSCEDNEGQRVISCFECLTEGVVRAVNTDAGCRFFLELTDGTMLDPIIPDGIVADNNGVQNQDPLSSFELKDGQSVSFDFERVPEQPSQCLDDSKVRITCIVERQAQSL